jgi:hypothetical protein
MRRQLSHVLGSILMALCVFASPAIASEDCGIIPVAKVSAFFGTKLEILTVKGPTLDNTFSVAGETTKCSFLGKVDLDLAVTKFANATDASTAYKEDLKGVQASPYLGRVQVDPGLGNGGYWQVADSQPVALTALSGSRLFFIQFGGSTGTPPGFKATVRQFIVSLMPSQS